MCDDGDSEAVLTDDNGSDGNGFTTRVAMTTADDEDDSGAMTNR